jgi:hypothetical protein
VSDPYHVILGRNWAVVQCRRCPWTGFTNAEDDRTVEDLKANHQQCDHTAASGEGGG